MYLAKYFYLYIHSCSSALLEYKTNKTMHNHRKQNKYFLSINIYIYIHVWSLSLLNKIHRRVYKEIAC
jgi:hypothetical protein